MRDEDGVSFFFCGGPVGNVMQALGMWITHGVLLWVPPSTLHSLARTEGPSGLFVFYFALEARVYAGTVYWYVPNQRELFPGRCEGVYQQLPGGQAELMGGRPVFLPFFFSSSKQPLPVGRDLPQRPQQPKQTGEGICGGASSRKQESREVPHVGTWPGFIEGQGCLNPGDIKV